MNSNPPDTSPSSDDTTRIIRPDMLDLRLPLTPNQIREQAQRVEEYLTTASLAASTQGTILDIKVTVTSPTTEVLHTILLQAGIPMATIIDSVSGTDNQPDPMTDAPALPTAGNDDGAQTPDAPPIDLDPIIETNANDNEAAPQRTPAPTPPRPQCKICMDDLAPEATIMINCGCTYCGTCLNDHIMHGLSSRAHYPARCCSAEGIDIGDTAPYLTFEVILRWSEVEAEYKERMPMYCQNKECAAHIPEGRLGGESKFIDCNSCHTDTCKECKQWRFEHSGEDLEACPEDIVSKEDRELATSEKWKQCPGCKNLVERSDGCNNMACECGTEFCYDCGVEFSPDHRCGCETIPDPDGWHHRNGEMAADLDAGGNNMTEDEYIEALGHVLVRADRDGHGPFANAVNAGNWLLDHGDDEDNQITWDGMEEEGVFWDGLSEEEHTLVFQAYERILRENAERADDPASGEGVGEGPADENGVGDGQGAAAVAIGAQNPLTANGFLDRLLAQNAARRAAEDA